ncbi:DNA polymerase [Thermoanaerobacter sp. A7A]|uniref:DNA polymerase n=1 Tax=Thermoanaerobacter sp. A7A TaxID=1350366 RepID=UPI0004288B7D|nr:DNA polymerase [Thermoanaerobacter sp. A7A]
MKKYSTCDCLLKGSVEIPYRPAQNIESDIVFVFESPGWDEIRAGKMLIGASWRRLNFVCEKIGLDISNIFLTNATRCMVDTQKLNDSQIGKILKACRPKLDLALRFSNRKLIVCFGRIAYWQVTGKKTAIKKARGNFVWSDEYNCYIYCTYHPAATLRNPSCLPLFESDLAEIKRFIDNGFKLEADTEIKWKEVSSIRELLDGGFWKDENGYFITAIDTETQGVNWYDPNSIVISYSIAKSPTEGWNIVLVEEVEKDKGDFNILVKRGGSKKNPIYEEVGIKKLPDYNRKISELKELLARQDIKKYFMNIKYELHRFMNLGITEWNSCCLDIKTAAHVLDSELYKDASLEYLTNLFTNIRFNHKDLVTDAEKEDMLTLLREDRDRFNKYACFDAVATLQVGLRLRQELLRDKKSLNYYINLAHPVESELLFVIERNGIKVSRNKIYEVKNKLSQLLDEKANEVKKLCPPKVRERYKDNFSLTRTIIIREALFKWKDKKTNKLIDYGFGLEPIEISSKTGEPLVDKKKSLFYIINRKYPQKVKNFVTKYLEWAEINKLLSNYISNIEELSKYDGRLHPSASITFTSSGRTGFRKPALQTIPKRSESAKYIRMLFEPDNPDEVLVEVDYKVSELRWVAHVADDKTFQEIFKSRKDPHLITALRMKGLPDDYQVKDAKEKKLLRQNSKCLNFGLIYGMLAPTLKEYAEQGYGVRMTLKQAEEFRNKWFSFYRDIPDWHRRSRYKLEKTGYLRSVFGRIRRLPQIWSNDKWVREQAFRTGINFEIQGPSSDGTLLGGYNLIKDPRYNPKECKLVLFIHDALIFSVKKDKLDFYINLIKEHLENLPTEKFGFKLKVPLEVEVAIGESLDKMKEI